MKIMAINGSPREKGNTSTILEAILEGAKESGAETTHVWLDRIDLKGCMGCLVCREKPGFCQRQDGLAPYLEAMKTVDGIVVGCPIYMYHICGQMKIFVDRIYSFYINQAGGTYRSALPPGKRLAVVTTQGNPDPESFQRVIRWFGGMLQGLGMEVAGQIVHADSHVQPAWKDPVLLEKARQVGRRLASKDKK